MTEIIVDAILDTAKMLPILFLTYLFIQLMGKYLSIAGKTAIIAKSKAAPVAGALVGIIPQCGFSAMASTLYSQRIITVGTLIAVFLSTSDEAIPVLLADSGKIGLIGPLLLAKLIIATLSGVILDILFKKTPFEGKELTPKADKAICNVHTGSCGCCDHEENIFVGALKRSLNTGLFVLAINLTLNFVIEYTGFAQMGAVVKSNGLSPLFWAMVGLVPNCSVSILITRLYAQGIISFASAVAGLCAGAGTGLAVLFKENKNMKQNIKIAAILWTFAAASGLILTVFG
ncbi:MAG: putative manganese transporter [Oscillospiraceae bacterium]